MNPLNSFYSDAHMRESVKAFFLETLKDIAATKALNGESTGGIKDAKETIDQVFILLADMYEPKEVKKPESSR